MKLLIFLLLFTLNFQTFGNDEVEETPQASASDDVPSEEVETFLTSIKEAEVEEKLLDSEQFKTCKSQAQGVPEEDRSKKIEECIKSQVSELTPEALEDLSKNLKLKAFDRNATKSAKSIREYLTERLRKTLYGPKKAKDEIQKLKDTNYVDHKIFVELYKNQIGKNLLVEVSQYCLENFGVKNGPEYLLTGSLVQETDEDTGKVTDVFVPTGIQRVAKKENGKYVEIPNGEAIIPNSDLNNFVNPEKFKEYRICPKLQNCGESGPEDDDNYRTVGLLEILKNQDLKLNKDDPKMIGLKYQFCAGTVIKNMCEVYKCNNTYGSDTKITKDKTAGVFCRQRFGIEVSNASETKNTTGQMACNLVARLKEYRKVLQLTDDTLEKFQKDFRPKTDLSAIRAASFKQDFNASDSTLDDLTSISSTELTDKVDTFSKGEDEAERLQEECIDGDVFNEEECEELAITLDKDKFDEIKQNDLAQRELYLKRVENAKNNKEELEKLLKENGLYERYKDLLDDPAALETDLVNIITDNYKAEREAAISDLSERFKKEIGLKNKKNDSSEAQTKKEIAQEKIDDIETQKKRVETLYQYSNIASSFLDVESSDGKSASNVRAREIELADLEDGDLVKEYLKDAPSTEQSSGSSTNIDLNVIDTILGNNAKDDK